jgi:two-component system phosphate regulon sensor histidine kinase PhoR
MLLLGFCLGIAVSFGFWLWRQLHLNHAWDGVLLPYTFPNLTVALPLVPRLWRTISSAQHRQQNLRQLWQNYQDLLDFAPLGYLQVDEENQLLWCNQQAKEILYLQRWQPGQVRLLLELVRSYELDQLIEKTRNCQKPQVQDWIFHPSRENAVIMLRLKPLALRASTFPLPKSQVGVFLENRQPLWDLHQERDRSFSDLAHELRTPLTSIRLVVETLQNRLDPPLDRWVNNLMQEVDRLIGLVESWLELTQMETNPTMQLNYEIVELRSLITSVWETLEPLAQRHQLTIAYSFPESIYIRVDKSRMYQVFVNLLDNSIKYSPPHTTIQIAARIEAVQGISLDSPNYQFLEINIIDSGIGFAEEDLPHVFERFYRGDKSRSSLSIPEDNSAAVSGSGLGLAIVKQIILAHKGTIRAMNHHETGGAWMQIQLPGIVLAVLS